jgi:hypothetical protein
MLAYAQSKAEVRQRLLQEKSEHGFEHYLAQHLQEFEALVAAQKLLKSVVADEPEPAVPIIDKGLRDRKELECIMPISREFPKYTKKR